MNMQKFQPKDFKTYQSWYEDEIIMMHLGSPPDKEWLDYILKDKAGAQYCFFEKEVLIAVIGIIFPDKKHSHFYITDIAVNPQLRGQGVGKSVVKKFIKMHPLEQGQSYKAFVDIENKAAQLFFEKLGWYCESRTPDQDNMLCFTYLIK